jgi:hypothetical protein
MGMKRCLVQKPVILIEPGKLPFGILLGFDFAAEHEWGIDPLMKSLGLPAYPFKNKSDYGLKGRTIRSFDKEYLLFQSNNLKTCLSFEPGAHSRPQGWDNRDLRDREPVDIIAAWNMDSFAIVANNQFESDGHSVVTLLNDMHKAFSDKDIAIWLVGARDPFLSVSSGLLVAIASRVPEEGIYQLKETDIKSAGK